MTRYTVTEGTLNALIENVADALRGAGWTVALATKTRALPARITRRHPRLPPLAIDFFTTVQTCTDRHEESWFLTAADFSRTRGDGFRWDEFERMMIEDEADTHRTQAVRTFWDAYLPIFQAVGGDYQFLALGTDPDSAHFGRVVWGDVADFDAPLVIAETYEDFLARLCDVARRQPGRTAADDTIARLIHAGPPAVRSRGGWWTHLKRWWAERPR